MGGARLLLALDGLYGLFKGTSLDHRFSNPDHRSPVAFFVAERSTHIDVGTHIIYLEVLQDPVE